MAHGVSARCLACACACVALLPVSQSSTSDGGPQAAHGLVIVGNAAGTAAGRKAWFLARQESDFFRHVEAEPPVVAVEDDAQGDVALASAPALEASGGGSLRGALAFLLVLLPLLYVLLVGFLDKGIVVVARPQRPLPPTEQAFDNMVVLVASIEHDITYDLNVQPPAKPEKAKVSAGGLGKVAGQLQRIHPTDLISVHPVYKDTVYGFERPQPVPEGKRHGWYEDEPLNLTVDGRRQTVLVFRRTVPPEQGKETLSPQVTYLMLEHPWFRGRTGIYLDQPGSVATLRFFSLWNQAVGALIAKEDPQVYQCPDYHTALAPWYALRACGAGRPPPRVAVVLHNAEYQGAISSQQLNNGQKRRLSKILDLPQRLVEKRMMIEGGFNMLQAGMEYVLLTQKGFGVCAVSNTYAEESKVKHRVLWPLPKVVGLDNPMLENERPKPGPPLLERRRAAKAALYAHRDFRPDDGSGEPQQGFGYLREDFTARIFVFLGRWVKQKGMDYIADIAEWMVTTHPRLQLAIIGPPGDSFGTYTELKLKMMATDSRYLGRLKVLPVFYNINQVHEDVKYAFDFCFMPSRDEPFGYVDIEFGWFGALTVGAITGGLGKVPGVYYMPSNVNSAAHICHLFKGCVDKAMELSDAALTAIAEAATQYSFPVETWQADLLKLYKTAINEGSRLSPDSQRLARIPEVGQLLGNAQLLPVDKRVPRRAAVRTGFGAGSLEPHPKPFSLAQMEDLSMAVGKADATRSFTLQPSGEGQEEEMELDEFIRSEVADSAIQGEVQRLVQQQAEGAARTRCWCREGPPSAQDVLAVTQWEAMRDGEYTDDRGMAFNAPFCGICRCCTKFMTSWVAGETWGLKRIDLAIAFHYLTAPLLQALCVGLLPDKSRNKWPAVFGALMKPFAVVLWTKISMTVQPNRVMAIAVVLRIPLLFLVPIVEGLGMALGSILVRILLFACLSALAGADQLFVYYNFMGAAVGDVSKLALRMGMCNGILVATAFIGQLAVGTAVKVEGSSSLVLSVFGLALDALLAFIYVCAPAPYREFCLPDWDLQAMWKHRRTLKYLGAYMVLSAITDTSISGAATVLWRTSTPPFNEHKVLGASASMMFFFLVPLLLTVGVVAWSFLVYRLPNHASAMVKAGAFLLAPPALMRCLLVLLIENNDSYVTPVDCLFLVSLLLDVVQSTCVYIAVLSVVGSRWRFVSFMTVALFCRGLLSFIVKFVVAAVFSTDGLDSRTFAHRWMPLIAAAAVLQWALTAIGFLSYDQESQALLTMAKRRLALRNKWGLRQYLSSLEH